MNGFEVFLAPLLFIALFTVVGGIIAWISDVPIYQGLLLGLVLGPVGWILTGLLSRYGRQVHTVLEARLRSAVDDAQRRNRRGAGHSVADELTKLVALKKSGALTDDEFTEQKRRLLAG
jgi:hypothetical protein